MTDGPVMHDYAARCDAAAREQGLGPFLDAEGWTVEQTGGFTMVACRYLPAEPWAADVEPLADPCAECGATAYTIVDGRPLCPGHESPAMVWTVTSEDGYFACLQTVAGWESGEVEPPEDAYRPGLTLAQALALGSDA